MSSKTYPLGRIAPSDDEHIRRYPLLLSFAPAEPMPTVSGINWYDRMFDPVKLSDGRYWIGVDERGRELSDLGRIAGGHAIASRPPGMRDIAAWHDFYVQPDGSCTGYSGCRAKTWIDRIRYDAHWLYEQAQLADEWPETPPEEGSSVRAAFDVMREQGLRRVYRGKTYPPDVANGIAANRWMRTVDEMLDVLGSATLRRIGAVPFNNTWDGWPREVFVPLALMQRLLDENGECTTFTDR